MKSATSGCSRVVLLAVKEITGPGVRLLHIELDQSLIQGRFLSHAAEQLIRLAGQRLVLHEEFGGE